MISYAQNFEDVTLWRALHDVSHGRYVDVGALHPEIDSVTKWFYDQGWCGINLEPVPEMFDVIAAARPRDTNIRAAAGAVAGLAEMAVVPESMGLSSLDVSGVETNVGMPYTLVQVEVRPLREVLEPFVGCDIHFLKIDAEGTEHDVLLGMDFTRFRPWIVVVEATAPLSQTKTEEKWEDILHGANYQHAYFDGLNEFYVAAEKIELAKKLAVPPNVFDKFELAATVRERQERKDLQREVSGRDSQLAAMREELERTHSDLAGTLAQLAASFTETNRLSKELTATQAELKLANEKIARLTEQLRGSEAAIAGLSEDLSELAQALKKGRETELACQRQLRQVLNSRSFRWLAPARRLRELLLPHRQ
jgi:FkbM family methyltransferase